MSKITYADKETLYTNNDIPANKKVQSSDMNEIKNIVNENDDKVGDLNDLNTTDKTSIVNAINEIGTDYIIETGSNANGYYEKYASGTLKQWGKVTVTDELKTANSSTGFYRTASEQILNFPIPFVGDMPVLNLTAQSALNFAYVSTNNLDKTGFYPLTSYSAPGATRYVHWTAIGKWK